MDLFQTLRVSLRMNSSLITFAFVVLYVTFEVGKHSVMRVARELICGLVCHAGGALHTVIQSHFSSIKAHFLLHLLAGSIAATTILNPMMT